MEKISSDIWFGDVPIMFVYLYREIEQCYFLFSYRRLCLVKLPGFIANIYALNNFV